MRYEKKELTNQIRAKQSGQMVQLSKGKTYYELKGAPANNLVVLVHGFSMPSCIWEPLFLFLLDKGFSVLRYDLYGRGYSDRPKLKYNKDLFVDQLHELLSALNLNSKPYSLMGLSMGGPICIHYTDKYPQFVNRLVLSDPAGFPFNGIPFIMKIPGLGKFLFKTLGPNLLLKKIDTDFGKNVDISHLYDCFREQMEYKGFLDAIFSTMFHFPMNTSKPAFQRVGRLSIPKLLIWGVNDTTVPFSLSQEVISTLPSVEFHAISNTSHIPHFEKPEEVNPIILEFLQSTH
ncbi:alpha/beta fold hydrolase [Candidatus Lokiarchaeum ossiferum]|uniref:alpha/beta fold hydrolase n=1 Tax=Candidatus Lokiarchaeum ossiferum TaxID=2951803 RepID=UPI00352E2B09